MTSPKPVTSPLNIRLRPQERRVLLFSGDLITAFLALLLALIFWARSDQWFSLSLDFLKYRPPAWFYFLPLVWMPLLIETYDQHRSGDWHKTRNAILAAMMIGLGLYLLFFFTYKTPENLPRRGVAGFLLLASGLTLIWRYIYIRIFTAPQFMRRMLIVGAGQTGSIILKIIKGLWPSPFHLVGLIDDDLEKIGTEIEGYPVIGGNDCLLDIIAEQNISDLIVAISGPMNGHMFQALLDAHEKGVEIIRMPVAYEELLGRVPIRYLEADWILRSFVDQTRVSTLYEVGKRTIDILVGLVGALIMLLTFPFIGAAIVLDSGFPIFYTQKRSGKGGRLYDIYKFRTMKQNAEANGQPQWAEENDVRATRVGRFLRKTHLDELPQIVNVLSGEMSAVGPRAERPELIEWFQQHVPFYRARLIVKPGITGWAQVNFGYASTIEETIVKLEYDLYYIKHRNLLMDIIVMLRTPATVLGLRGR